jgi:phytoene desaturase
MTLGAHALLPPPAPAQRAVAGEPADRADRLDGAARAGAGAGRPHAVVIGSGFGGLAAAVRLGARGWRVTVLERLDAPGGRAYVFRQQGYTFDAGPTIVTAPFLFEELWQLTGRRLADDVELRPLDPFYRIRFDDGSHFDARAGEADARAEVARIAPADVDGYERFMRGAERIYRIGFEQLGDQPFDRFTDMLRIAPQMLKLRSHESLYRMAARHVRDERLRFALSFHPLFVGGNPFAVTSIYGLITHLERAHGVHYAVGGTGRLVQGLVGLVERQGNRLRCGAEVDRILVEGGRAVGVELADGERIGCDLVVSNADPAWTYGQLLRDQPRRRWTDAKLERAHYSMGLVVWYFGTRRRYDAVPHHSIVLGPRYRGLLDDIFRNKRLSDDFSCYLHRPTASDAALAPPGCDAFYALVPVPHLDAGIDWRREAAAMRARIARRLDATLLPGFEAAIETERMLTPLDFRERLLAPKGAAFSFEPRLSQSAWFRPHNRSEELAGLYLVGAGTHPGAGLPGVLSSARVLDRFIAQAHHA